jgi:hypothetical protein
MRYSIIVREYGSNHDVDLIQVGANPQAIVEGLRQKTLNVKLKGRRKATQIPRYPFIQIVDRGAK